MFNPKAAVTVRGKYHYGNTNTTTVDTLSLSPLNLDARCIALSDNYMLFRFTKFHVKFIQAPAGATAAPNLPIAIGYSPALPTTAPTSIQEVLDCAVSSGGPSQGIYGFEIPHLRLGRKILTTNAPKWFRRGTAFDDLLEIQGRIFTCSPLLQFNVQPIYFFVEWEMELASPLSAADTLGPPAVDQRLIDRLKALREEMKERDEREIVMINAPRDPPDPVLDKIKDLLLRDNMTRVNQG